MQPGPLVGKGLTAEVFAWGEDRVVKLFFDWVRPDRAQQELQATRAVHALGYPAPAAHEVITLCGRLGLVLDRIHGISMVQQVQTRPWKLFSAARQLAELHANLHARAAPPGLISHHERIEQKIADAQDLGDADRKAARDSLPLLPEGAALCHGDFHPANVLLTPKGPVIIDWSGATRGHPLGDVSRTVHLFKCAELPRDASWHLHLMLRFARLALLREYLKRYFQLCPGSPEDLAVWDPAQKAFASAWRSARNLKV